MLLRRIASVAVSFAVVVALAGGMSRAQDEKKGTAAKATDKEKTQKAAIPDYFGDVGLSEKQKDEVRKATQPMDEKIASLKKQVAELQKQIAEQEAAKLVAAEKLLSDVQKAALKERRATADAEKAANQKAKKTANGDAKKPAEKKP